LNPVRAYLEQFVKDDRPTIDNLLLTGVSSVTDNPINLALIAPSSEGKTYPALKVAGLFPNAVILTGATKTAFFYEKYALEDSDGNGLGPRLDDLRKQKDELEQENESTFDVDNQIASLLASAKRVVDLSGKLLIFLDAPDNQLWDALKPLLSHDAHESEYKTTQGTSSGTHRTATITLRGWPAVIFCSARSDESRLGWEEIRTRFNITAPTMTEAKYREAHRLSADLLGTPGFALKGRFTKDTKEAARQYIRRVNESIRELQSSGWREGKGSETDNMVYNPFARKLAESFPANSGPRMRQFRYVLRYCNASTLFNIERRAKFAREGKHIGVLACYVDLRTSVDLLVRNFTPLPVHKQDFFRDHIVPYFEQKRAEGHVDVIARTRDIHDWLASRGKVMGMNSLKQTYIDAFVDAGLLDEEVNLLDKKSKQYSLVQVRRTAFADLAAVSDFPPEYFVEVWQALQQSVIPPDVKVMGPDGKEITDAPGLYAYTLFTNDE
jgi:hypothetical protein